MTEGDDRGIYYGWFVVGACFVGAFASLGLSLSFGVFFEPLLAEFDLSRGVTSLVFGVHTLVLYVSGAVLGVLADRYGVRRLLGVGLVLLLVGLVWTSRADSLAALLFAYGVVTAVGMGLIYVVAYATVPRWFERNRGFASGLATSGLAVGLLLIAPVASVLIVRFGWRNAYLAIVVAVTLALVVATVVIDDTPLDRGVDPSDEFPAGYPESPIEGDSGTAGADAAGAADSDDSDQDTETTTAESGVDIQESWREQLADVGEIATSRSFLLVFFGWVLLYGAMYVVLVHVVAYATDLGLSGRLGAIAVGVIGATSIVGRLGIGFGADRVGRTRAFVLSGVAMAGSTLLLPLISGPIGLLAVAVVFGLGQGGNGALLSPITADLFGTANANALFGIISLSFAVSGLLAPPLAGALHDATGTYAVAFALAGIVGVAGAGLVGAAGRVASSREHRATRSNPHE